MRHKFIHKVGILFFVGLILWGQDIEGMEESFSPPPQKEAFVITRVDTYLAAPNGTIVADMTSLVEVSSQEKKEDFLRKSPILLFGKFKKFGEVPQEVVQVVWGEMGIETKKELKKEAIHGKIESLFRYKSVLLPRKTKLKIKGDIASLKAQGETLLEARRTHMSEDRKEEMREKLFKGPLLKENEEEHRSKKEALIQENADSVFHVRDLDAKENSKDESDKKELENPQGSNQKSFQINSRKRQGQPFIPLKIEAKEPKKEVLSEKLPPPDLIDVEILKEGCSPRIDETQEMVVIQTRSLTRKNGKVIKEEPCSDSNEHYPIRRRYEGAPDKVSKEQGLAWPQYMRYWIDGTGSLQEIDRNCLCDTDNPFELREDEKACEVLPDFTSMRAIRQAQLYYKDRKKRRVVVEDCRPLTGAVPLMLEKVACDWRHDFERECSWAQSRIIAVQEGQEIRMTPCSDEGEPMAHQISTVGCDPIIEAGSGRRFAQVRTIIETPQGPLLITPCRPSQELQETPEGCETKFDHNLESGQSRGYTRFFHDIRGIKTYVTDCQPASQVFEHQRRLTGYEHHDDLKSSRPKTEIYIKVPYRGEVLVDSEKVREGEPSISYTIGEIKEELCPNEAKFEGCFQITPKKRIQVYKRPDETLFEEVIGEASPLKSHNLCKTSEELYERKSCSWYIKSGGRATEDIHWPHGEFKGEWLSCAEARSRVHWGQGGYPFFLYHTSFYETRIKTEFPSGEVSFTPWERSPIPGASKTIDC